MDTTKDGDLGLVSALARAAMAVLFAVNAVNKFMGSRQVVLDRMQAMFDQSGLPVGIVLAVTSVLPFVELGIALWLLSGFGLRGAWIAASALVITVGAGLLFVEQYGMAADHFQLVLLAGAGLATLRHDPWRWGL